MSEQHIFIMMAFFCGGYFLAMGSVLFGAWLIVKAMSGKDTGLFSPKEVKGEIFTIEDGSDSLFPEEVGESKAEEHVAKKSNAFLEAISMNARAE